MVFCGSCDAIHLLHLSILLFTILSRVFIVNTLLIITQINVFLWRAFVHDRNTVLFNCGSCCVEFSPWCLVKKMWKFIFLAELGRCRSLSATAFLWGCQYFMCACPEKNRQYLLCIIMG